MRRTSALAQLNEAVEQSLVTLVRGLPRVGRSSFLIDWQSERSDAKRCRTTEEIKLEPGIFILDHVDHRSVDAIINIARAAEEARSRTRLVVAPSDLRTSEMLRTELAGLAGTVELSPLRTDEISNVTTELSMAEGPLEEAPIAPASIDQYSVDPYRHWLRGGFPESLEAENDRRSLSWRRNMVDGLLARDYTTWGVERAFPLADVLHWLADRNGSELDESACPFAKKQELKSAVHVLELLGLVRRLSNLAARSNASSTGKQKIFLRDTGILHSQLGIESSAQLRLHSGIGESFESYATEALVLAADGRCRAQFYRAKNSDDDAEDEIDLVLDFPSQNGRLVAIEFKVSKDQKAKKGFYRVCDALQITDRFVVHSSQGNLLDELVHRLDLKSAIERIGDIACAG